jgi:hypothetical protein
MDMSTNIENIEGAGLMEFADVASLLDTELSDLASLEEFKVPPVGRYVMQVETETKDDGEHPKVVITYTMMEVKEVVNADDVPPKPGDKFSESFNIDNKYGVGKLKKILLPYAAHFGTTKTGETLEVLEGCMIEGTVRRREDKKNQDDEGNNRVYGTVVAVTVI